MPKIKQKYKNNISTACFARRFNRQLLKLFATNFCFLISHFRIFYFAFFVSLCNSTYWKFHLFILFTHTKSLIAWHFGSCHVTATAISHFINVAVNRCNRCKSLHMFIYEHTEVLMYLCTYVCIYAVVNNCVKILYGDTPVIGGMAFVIRQEYMVAMSNDSDMWWHFICTYSYFHIYACMHLLPTLIFILLLCTFWIFFPDCNWETAVIPITIHTNIHAHIQISFNY